MLKIKLLIVFLLISSFADAAIRPADGLWATSDDPAIGSGLMLTTQNDTTLVSVFTYDQDGNNAWYIASGQVDDEGVLEAELRQTENGTNMVEDSPQSASLTEATRTLRIDFSGTQVGSFSIDGSETKSIKANYYGKQVFYGFPALTGQWVVGSAENNESYILDLSMTTGPNSFNDSYVSSHPSTDGWLMQCFVVTIGFVEPECKLSEDSEFTDEDLSVEVRNIGSQHMVLNSPENNHKYHAFRLDNNQRLLPNDGFWRPYDDPAVGSGLVMHTQGDITAVLLYSYDDEGTPRWQIASGVFNENGLFSADLLTPSGGTAMENETQETASFNQQVQTLEIQMQGLELATFSVDGSTPKTIQNSNFGVYQYETDNLLINDQPFIFPNLSGDWVFIDYASATSKSGVLDISDISGSVSPLPPGAPPVYSGSYFSDDYQLSLSFVCSRFKESLEADSCTGRVNRESGLSDLVIYFQDIGFEEFSLYAEFQPGIERAPQKGYFFRIPN